MQVIRATLLLALVALTDVPASAQENAPAPSSPQMAIREILSVGAPPVTDIDAALGPEALAELRRVYAARDDRPIWPEAQGRALLDRLSEPDVTIGPKLRPLLDDASKRLDAADRQAQAGADLLLTALYGATAQALRPSAPSGFAAALAELIAGGDVASLLREPPKAETPPPLETPPVESPEVESPPPEPAGPPEPPAIARLRAAIAALQPQAETDWPRVPDGPKLQLGDSGPRVEALGRRLIASGDLQATAPGLQFDLTLQSALQGFQARHGLPDDGVAGAVTIAALNVPLKDRIATLSTNLQRLEREGRDWGDRYLALNIPAANYRFVDAGRTFAEGPAILGTPSTPTPRLDATIDRVQLRPSWRIPQLYADRYLWPRQEVDALYFIENGVRVTDDGLRQVPGRNNPLGPAKLLIAGDDRIAVHGAPGKSAFESLERFTSLGCVALPEIGAIAKNLLAADPAWTEGRIDGALAAGGTQTVTLAKPLPLHIVYETGWVDEDGTIEFRDDVYGWDQQPVTDNPVAEPCGS